MTHSEKSVSRPQNRELLAERQRELIADAHDINLYYHYSEAQASKLIGLSQSTLKRARNSGSIGFIQKGARVAYFGYHLVNFLMANSSCPNNLNASIN